MFKKIYGAVKTSRIKKLIKEVDKEWKNWKELRRKSSWGGIAISGRINKLQQELYFHGDRSRTQLVEINIETF